jgi:nicotinate-nucleotide adenylyltransferase
MVLVFGGSFNPPTLAHQKIIIKLQETYPNQKIILLPVGDDYKKQDLVPFCHRLNMLNLLVKDFSNIITSDIESKRPYGGTLKSLDELSKEFSDIHFVIGADNLLDFRTWIEYEKLLAKYPFIIMHRKQGLAKQETKAMMKNFKHTFCYLSFDEDISSTEIRRNIHKAEEKLTPSVYQYIIENHLYQEPTHV